MRETIRPTRLPEESGRYTATKSPRVRKKKNHRQVSKTTNVRNTQFSWFGFRAIYAPEESKTTEQSFSN